MKKENKKVVVIENERQQIIAHENRYAYDSQVSLETRNLELPTKEGEFMLALCERFGMITGQDNGEDSAGRAALRLMPENDVVERAANIARIAFQKLRATGNMTSIPKAEEIDLLFNREMEEA